jgi:hypothetical protein
MAIDTTVGGASANSWASLAEFKTYRDYRLPASVAVSAATDSQIEAALIVACRNINANFAWTGVAVDDVQALTWPRKGMQTRNGFTIPTTTNPKDLKDAQCEMAFQILDGANLVADDAAAKANVLGVKAGSVSVQFQQTNTSTSESVDMIMRRLTSEFAYLSNAMPGEVRRLLVPSWFDEPTIIRPIMFGAM